MHSLELQLANAVIRLNALQRKIDHESGTPQGLLSRAVQELEKALEEVRVAQEQLIENRAKLETLQEELTQQYEKYWQLFDEMPEAYIVTRVDTTIVEANQAAAALLNVSSRFLVGKTLSVFICTERTHFLHEAAQAAATTEPVMLTARMRPRERAPIDVAVKIRGGAATLRWVLRPV
jgi:PAS domain S-box-containing protein